MASIWFYQCIRGATFTRKALPLGFLLHVQPRIKVDIGWQTSRQVVYRTHVSIGRVSVSDLFFRPTKTIIFWLFRVKASEFFLENLRAHFYLISIKTTAAGTCFLHSFFTLFFFTLFSSLFVLHSLFFTSAWFLIVCVACRYVWTCKRTCSSVAWRIYQSARELAAA